MKLDITIAASETKRNNVKVEDRQAAGKYESSLLALLIFGTVLPYGTR
jgi:hypothetical protein